MKSETYSIILACLGGVAFIMQFTESIFHKDKRKWWKRTTFFGWGVLLLCSFTVVFGIMSIYANRDEKKIADSLSNIKIESMQQSLDSVVAEEKDIKRILADMNMTIKKNSEGRYVLVKTPTIVSSEKSIICPIQVIAKAKPVNETMKLCNGDVIRKQYAINKNGTLTIQYMKGKIYAGAFTINNQTDNSIKYDINTGTFDNTANGPFNDGDELAFMANVPENQEPASKSIFAQEVGSVIKDDFFSKPVTEISTSGQSYIINADFKQNTTTKTVTFTNGNVFYKGQMLLARR